MNKNNRRNLPLFHPTHIRNGIPNQLLPWLTRTGSLTSQFEQLSGCPLRVTPTFEGFTYISTSRSQQLLLPKRQMAWVREVALYGNDKLPWALATSTFPAGALHGKARRLRYLGNTPLGYILFGRHNPTCKRVITTRIIDKTPCYSRQNSYIWHGYTLIVEETFLPTFLARIGA